MPLCAHRQHGYALKVLLLWLGDVLFTVIRESTRYLRCSLNARSVIRRSDFNVKQQQASEAASARALLISAL